MRDVLARHSIQPRKRFGQNFLHDPAVCARIAAAVAPAAGESVLEIGPGLGAITRPLLALGARVTAVEVDPRIADYLEEDLRDEPGFRLVRGDIREVADSALSEARVLVGNLPYSITGPLLALLIEQAPRIDRAVVMIQREVATRLLAGAGGREIGAPSVLLRLLYDVSRVLEVGRGAFVPPPEVKSVVLRLVRREGALLDPALRDLVNRAYAHRRKMLRKTLGSMVASEEAIGSALVAIGRAPNARPEELEPGDWPRLRDELAAGDRG
ncbi:MAG: 16S rRNA (adenine(1518)-N(6)/adenine(1519)-N(6))-dimethyltransferase RsmA [bacterium]